MSGLRTQVRRAARTSVAGLLFSNVNGSQAISAVKSASNRFGDLIRHSFLYQWLAREPESEVIVIDLRETLATGLVIKLIENFVIRLTPYWDGSVLNRGFKRIVGIVEQTAETRTGQLITRVILPLDNPEHHEEWRR